MKKFHLWNLGLPRTGTTSTTAALAALGLRCNVPVAQMVAGHREDWPEVPADIPLICTHREFPAWLDSARAYFPRRSRTELKLLWYQHRAWVTELARAGEVGFLDVRDGKRGLHIALAKAYDGEPLPHLQARSTACTTPPDSTC